MASPGVNIRVNPELVKKAREKNMDLRKLLEKAISENLEICTECGQKIKKKK